jgi:hypothetical protein
MKLLFFIIPVFVALNAGAQSTAIESPKEKIEELNRGLKDRKFSDPGELNKFFDSLALQRATAQSPAPGLYHLPQDNMPCLVPDMNKVKQMPNLMKPRIPFNSEIPNAKPRQKFDLKKLKWKPVYISSDASKP